MRVAPAEFTTALAGMRVSRPWKGYGSAIFLELGQLSEVRGLHGSSVTGQACVSVEWDWRIELGPTIVVGSSNGGPSIHESLKTLRDSLVMSVEVSGQVPELLVGFSTGHVLRSMAMLGGNPQWSIRASEDRWLYAKDGQLIVGDGTEAPSTPEHEDYEIAQLAARRWGVPGEPPKLGKCQDCRFYVALDGTGHLLDYGCCSSSSSPLDGRVVFHTSGCTAFTAV